MTDHTLPPADLLRHAAFVRRLAFHLLRDDVDADDAAQQTLARALERPPRHGPGLRAWLETVLRNVVRMDRRTGGRRAGREARVARAEPLPSAEDAAGRAELLRRVADAVGSLDLSQREVVMMRHYDGLAPREIASRLGVPLATVKGRLRRAHERLRERLDEESGGNVEGWRSAFAFMLGSREGECSGAPTWGGTIVGTATKAAAGIAAVALLGTAAWWAFRGENEPSVPDVLAPGNEVSLRASKDDDVPTLAGRSSAGAASSTAVAPGSAADDWRRASAGVVSLLLPPDWTSEDAGGRAIARWSPRGSDGAGTSFSVLTPEAAEELRRSFSTGYWNARVVDGFSATLVRHADSASPMSLQTVLVTLDGAARGAPEVAFAWTFPYAGSAALAPIFDRIFESIRMDVPGRVGPIPAEPDPELLSRLAVDVAGDAIEGVVVWGRDPVPRLPISLEAEALEHLSSSESVSRSARRSTTGPDGVFRFSGVPAGRFVLILEGQDVSRRLVYVPAHGQGPSRRLVVVLGTGTVTGRLFDRMGQPRGGAEVTLTSSTRGATVLTSVTDPEGRFRFDHIPAGAATLDGWLEPRSGAGADHRTAALTLALGEPRVVELGSQVPEPLWTGAVRTAAGSIVRGRTTFRVVNDTTRGTETVVGDASGTFARRLPAGHCRVVGLSVDGLLAPIPWFSLDIPTGGLSQDVVIPGSQVAGVLVDDGGRPVVDAGTLKATHVCVTREGASGAGAAPVLGCTSIRSDGSFAVVGLPPGRFRLEASTGPMSGLDGSAHVVDVREGADTSGVALTVRPR